MEILSNHKKANHLSCLNNLAKKSDTLIIVSPFLSDDIPVIIQGMHTIKKITLYTTLQKYDDTAHKIVSLHKLYQYCSNQSIDLLIKIDDELHGKVYLFYDGIRPRGFVLTSGNFTSNGLMYNHEYGLCVVDNAKQKEIADIIMSNNTYDLSYMQLCQVLSAAQEYIANHPTACPQKFEVHKLINKKSSSTQKSLQKYYLKPVGTSKDPFVKPMIIKERDLLGFTKKPKSINKGDVLLLHSVGPSNIVGYYVVISDEAIYVKSDTEDRWPWKVEAECHSSKFSSEWWDYELKTQMLVDDFLATHNESHITAAGGNTIGALQWGCDKIQITKEFAQYIISRLPD